LQALDYAEVLTRSPYVIYNQYSLPLKHLLGPRLVLACLLAEVLLLDIILTLVSLFYDIALLRNCSSDSLPIHVTLSHWEGVEKAEYVVAWMLLFSALMDTLLSLDVNLNDGQFSLYILTLGHLMLLPVLSFAVLVINNNTPSIDAGTIATDPLPKTLNVLVSAPKA